MTSLNEQQRAEMSDLCGLQRVQSNKLAQCMNAHDILNPQIGHMILDDVASVLGTRSRKIAASLLIKRHAFLATAACLYPMSAYNCAPDLSLGNTLIDYRYDGKLWQSSMHLHDLHVTAPASAQDRSKWRAQICRQLFADNLTRVIKSLTNLCGVSQSILWENLAVRVYSLYERRLKTHKDQHVQQRIQDDFDFLLTTTDFALFGINHNPLQQYVQNSITDENTDIRYRETCCYYYAVPGGTYCGTCPLPHRKRGRKQVDQNRL